MGATWRVVLRVTGVMAVGAVLTASCASQQMLDAPLADLEKLKVDLKVDHNFVKPIKTLKVGGAVVTEEFAVCTQTDISGGKCQRLGYPMKKDGTGEYLGNLSRAPVLILTDVASPGGSCVCYGNTCYCR